MHEHSDPLKDARKRIQRTVVWIHTGILIYDAQIFMDVGNVVECLNFKWREIMWNANLMQQGNFIDVFLARHVSGTYAHHQER